MEEELYARKQARREQDMLVRQKRKQGEIDVNRFAEDGYRDGNKLDVNSRARSVQVLHL